MIVKRRLKDADARVWRLFLLHDGNSKFTTMVVTVHQAKGIFAMQASKNALIPTEIDGHVIHQREVDGYFNATGMCGSAGRRWADYNRLDTTKAFLEELSADMGIPISELIQALRGGTPEFQGTWVHPLVATDLARWLSPKFHVAVIKLATAWMKSHGNIEIDSAVLIPDMRAEELFQLAAERSRKERLESEQKDIQLESQRLQIESSAKQQRLLAAEKAAHKEKADLLVNKFDKLRRQVWGACSKAMEEAADLYDKRKEYEQAKSGQNALELIPGGKQYGNVCEWFGEEMHPSAQNGRSLKCSEAYELYDAWCKSRRQTPVKFSSFDADMKDELGMECVRVDGHDFYVGLAPKRSLGA